jgi:hypothetical protein
MRQLEKPESDNLEQLKIRNPHWAEEIARALHSAGVAD